MKDKARKPQRAGKDEMNLVEFPLTLIGERQPSQTNQRVIFARPRRDGTVSRLTILPSAYGFPMALDDQVLVALIQVSRRLGFPREVPFSRYELIETMGWDQGGKSYERIDLAVNRLCTVSYHWDNAWWDKEAESWVDENFGILDSSRMYDREKRLAKAGKMGQLPLPLSQVVWSDRLYRSFKAGYLKNLDMDTYRALKTPIAKRLYRYLDKHFYRKAKVSSELKEFARSKLGYLGDYDNDRLRSLLEPGIKELEQTWGMLRPASRAHRFRQIRRGTWEIVFERNNAATRAPSDQEPSEDPLVVLVCDRRVGRAKAEELVSKFPAEQIREKVELHDWMLLQGQPVTNPSGWLIAAIEENYAAPVGFESSLARETKRQAKAAGKAEEVARKQAQEAERTQASLERERPLRAHWDSLSTEEQDAMEEAAVQAADSFKRRLYQDAKRKGLAATVQVYRELIVFAYIEQEILKLSASGE